MGKEATGLRTGTIVMGKDGKARVVFLPVFKMSRDVAPLWRKEAWERMKMRKVGTLPRPHFA